MHCKMLHTKRICKFLKNGVFAEGLLSYMHVVKNEDDKIVCAIGKECGKLVMLSSKTAIVIVHSTGIFLRYVGTSSNIVKYLES